MRVAVLSDIHGFDLAVETVLADLDATGPYDAVVIATHSGQALAMLAEPTSAQREVLGAIGYSRNVALLHTDTSLLPDAEHARALDAMLWTRQPMSFLPHVASASPLAGETPITLATAAPEGGWPHDDVLINLAAELPPQFERFKMLVEVVGTEDHHRQPARERWRHYAAQGMPPTPHNMKG